MRCQFRPKQAGSCQPQCLAVPRYEQRLISPPRQCDGLEPAASSQSTQLFFEVLT